MRNYRIHYFRICRVQGSRGAWRLFFASSFQSHLITRTSQQKLLLFLYFSIEESEQEKKILSTCVAIVNHAKHLTVKLQLSTIASLDLFEVISNERQVRLRLSLGLEHKTFTSDLNLHEIVINNLSLSLIYSN
jgi:hypothetical protein